ncbi:hypothetical protein ACLOJK_025713 [Asimina triloba]
MEALLLPDQSISPHNHRVRNGYASVSSLSSFHYLEVYSGNPNVSNHPPNKAKDSLFGNPPWVASFSSFPSLQPPLLPLPLARNPSLPYKTRRLSAPSANPRKSNTTINKTKDQKSAPKKDSSRSPSKSLRAVSSTARLGPHPSKLPKELPPVVLRSSSSSSSSSSSLKAQSLDELDDHSGSIFSLAPHPSSLPLPRFSLRPKPTGYNAEAGRSADAAGATDDLRRLLRLPESLMRTRSGDGVSGLFHPY